VSNRRSRELAESARAKLTIWKTDAPTDQPVGRFALAWAGEGSHLHEGQRDTTEIVPGGQEELLICAIGAPWTIFERHPPFDEVPYSTAAATAITIRLTAATPSPCRISSQPATTKPRTGSITARM
jgi:hypothetical protein